MTAPCLHPPPADLPPDQQAQWLRRQRLAQHALDTHTLAGSLPSVHTVAQLQRYVSGETTLANALAQAREPRP